MPVSNLTNFATARPATGPARQLIVESWMRSEAAGIERSPRAPELRRIDDGALAERLRRSQRLIAAATPHLQWLTSTFAAIRHVACVTDSDGIVLHSAGDSEFLSRFGLTPGYDWSERTMGTNGVGTALASGKPVAVIGAEHYVEAFQGCTCTAAPICDASGAIVGAVDFTTGASDGSAERLALVAHVAYMIERELRFEESEHALTEAGRRKDEFLAMVSHELRNPLAPIAYGVRIVETLGRDRPQLRQACELMNRQVSYLTRLLDDLLDVSRMVHGRIDLTRRPTDFAAAVSSAVESVRTQIELREQRLRVACPPIEARVNADAVRLVQIVVNLLQNASKFTPPRGAIDVALHTDDGEAVLRVKDSGMGLAPELLGRIFERFVQAGAPGSGGGLGLGLFLVKSLVELHGGSVSAHSDGPGRGSEFVVRLPLLA